jgi:hypothetical protein
LIELMTCVGGYRALASGGKSRQKSGKIPPGPRSGCDNLGALRGIKAVHRHTDARVLLSLAAAYTAQQVAAAR